MLDRAVASFGWRVEDEIEKAVEGKKPGAAQAAAYQVLARYGIAPMKFAEPKPTRR